MSTLIEKPRFSCALAAQQTVLAIPGGIPVIHAGPGCASKAAGFAAFQSGLQGEGYAGRTHISCLRSQIKINHSKKSRILHDTVTFFYVEWIDTKNVVTLHAITAQITFSCFKIPPTKILH